MNTQHDLEKEILHLKDEFNAAKTAFVLITVDKTTGGGQVYSNIASGKLTKELLTDAINHIPDDVSGLTTISEDLEDDVTDSEFIPC